MVLLVQKNNNYPYISSVGFHKDWSQKKNNYLYIFSVGFPKDWSQKKKYSLLLFICHYSLVTVHSTLFIRYCSAVTVHDIVYSEFCLFKGGCPLSWKQAFTLEFSSLRSLLGEKIPCFYYYYFLLPYNLVSRTRTSFVTVNL